MSIENVSRRNFLGGVFSAGALVLAARILPEEALADTNEYHGKAASAALRCLSRRRSSPQLGAISKVT